MARPQPYRCSECGETFSRWTGQCDACGSWNSISEATSSLSIPKKAGKASSSKKAPPLAIHSLDDDLPTPKRIETGIKELDRVLGGGIVPGSAVLVGGDPGIGKSTLMLQAACALANSKRHVLYVSGEESTSQIGLRSKRLNKNLQNVSEHIHLSASINLDSIEQTLEMAAQGQKTIPHKNGGTGLTCLPDVLIIDSIQTMWSSSSDSAPGSVSQVRACAFELIRLAKAHGYAVILIGHVTKEGALAGPRTLEHMVDTVLYFEGDRGHQFRILRGAKNRFGATDEIGVFSMQETGLEEVPNPSALFLAERRGNITGSAVYAGLEGTRPVLLEIQALLSKRSGDGSPKRVVIGWDNARLTMILAILEARCGIRLNDYDVHLNVAGGLKITEPAADLAVAAALLSSLFEKATPAYGAYFGEIGLSGELRQAPQTSLRLRECAKMGFESVFYPKAIKQEKQPETVKSLKLTPLGHLTDLVALFKHK